MNMKILILAVSTAVIISAVPATAGSAFWNSYYAARGGYEGGDDITDILANQRNTEAIINEMRAARGKPPCSIGLLGQWQGRPAC